MNFQLQAFIPNHLDIKDQPDLYEFPNEVVYMSFKKDSAGRLVAGVSTYHPVLESLFQKQDIWELRYDNKLSTDCWLRIIYLPQTKCYRAEKYIRHELIVITDGGPDWDQFFTHVTLAGLQADEKCEFLTII